MHLKDLFSKQCCLATVGVCMIGFGAIFSVFWLEMFERNLAKEMQVAPHTRSFEMWKTPPMPMSIDIYLFNWTNPRDFDHWEKPVLEEIGPFRFTELMDKVDIEWSPHNASVSYRKKSTYYFDEAGSRGRLNDTITSLNIIALSAAAKAARWNYVNQKSVSMGLSVYDQRAHVTKSADELLFAGYQDDMIDIARAMPSFLGSEKVEVPYDRFGWFYMRNGTSNQTGHFNMNTGAADISKIGQLNWWNYANRTAFFPDECGMINGSAGEFYPPHQTRERPVSFYSADLCRTLDFDFETETEVHGVKGFKYSGGERSMDNGTAHPENMCFNVGERVPSGVMNVSACRYGTPVFMSFPHFYAADPFYLDQVEGMRPEKERHEFAMTMEPETGVPLEVAARLQINMLIQPTPNIALYQNAPRMFFPVLWFEQVVRMDESMAGEIRLLKLVPAIGYAACAVLVGLGVVLVGCLPAVRAMRRCMGCGVEQAKGAGGATGSGKQTTTAVGGGGKFAANLEGAPLMVGASGAGAQIVGEKDPRRLMGSANGMANGGEAV